MFLALRRFFRTYLFCLVLLPATSLSGCGIVAEKKQSEDANMALAQASLQHPLSPEQTEELVSDVATNWFYGQGLGETMLAVGTTVLFPPYGIYLLGNAALSLSGYEEIRVSKALPDSGEDVWNSLYDGVTSVPGQVTATLSSTEYVTKNKAEKTLAKYLPGSKSNSAEDSVVKQTETPVLAGVEQGSVKAWR